MRAELVSTGTKVWVHQHYRKPFPGVIVSDKILHIEGSIYSFVTVRYVSDSGIGNFDEEIGGVTINGDPIDRAYYFHNRERVEYKIQAVNDPSRIHSI